MNARFLPVLLGLLVLVARPPRALALAGDLTHPSLALPSGYPADQRDQLLKALADESAKFLGGRFINAHTTLRYGGDTQGLNRLLEGLMGVPQLRLEIRFRRAPGEAAFEIQHQAWTDAGLLQIVINTGSPQVDLESLRLPLLTTGSGARSNPAPTKPGGVKEGERPNAGHGPELEP